MPNRYKIIGGGTTHGSTQHADLACLVAGSCGFTLRRVEFSYARNAFTGTQKYSWGEFDLVRGTSPNNPQTPRTIFSVEQGNPVSPLATAYATSGADDPESLWSCIAPEADWVSVDFEGPNGITVLPDGVLNLVFNGDGSTDTTNIICNVWFEE